MTSRAFGVCACIAWLLAALPSVTNAADCGGANVALGTPAAASLFEAHNPPNHAVDGDTLTGWNAGNFVPQWIELDLGADMTLSCIRLLVDTNPDCDVLHYLIGRTNGGDEVTLASYSGPVRNRQWLELATLTPMPVRFLRVSTTVTQSWVAWFEIQAFTPSPTDAQRSTWGALKAVYR